MSKYYPQGSVVRYATAVSYASMTLKYFFDTSPKMSNFVLWKEYSIFLAFLLLSILVSCSSKNENNQQELSVEDSQFHENAYNNGQIIVIESFHPTIILTEHQKEVSLDSLVEEYSQHNSIQNEDVGTQISLARAGKVITPVSVPKESDLAKAFFLQEFWLFYDQNRTYINSLRNPQKQNKTREEWDKYL